MIALAVVPVQFSIMAGAGAREGGFIQTQIWLRPAQEMSRRLWTNPRVRKTILERKPSFEPKFEHRRGIRPAKMRSRVLPHNCLHFEN